MTGINKLEFRVSFVTMRNLYTGIWLWFCASINRFKVNIINNYVKFSYSAVKHSVTCVYPSQFQHRCKLGWLCTCKSSSLLSGHRSLWVQISLVTHQHDHNMGVSVFVQLLQPALHTLVSEMFGDIIDQQGSSSPSVIPVWRRFTL